MLRRFRNLQLVFCLTLLAGLSFGGQGVTCGDFNEMSEGEKRKYIEGYTFGAAMELKYFKNNLFSENFRFFLKKPKGEEKSAELEKAIHRIDKATDYIDRKYDLINIAAEYEDDFFNRVLSKCESKDYQGIGMFDLLPTLLEQMQETGEYEVHGM